MTDQADKAAENRIAVQNLAIICFHRGWNAHREKMKKASPEWIELRNRCAHEMSDLFESLRSHSAPRELVDDLIWMTGMDRNANTEKVLDRLRYWIAALSAQEPKVCEWVDDDPFWIISCQKVGLSHSFHEPVIVRKWKVCPYCTNPIEVKESDVRQGGKG